MDNLSLNKINRFPIAKITLGFFLGDWYLNDLLLFFFLSFSFLV